MPCQAPTTKTSHTPRCVPAGSPSPARPRRRGRPLTHIIPRAQALPCGVSKAPAAGNDPIMRDLEEFRGRSNAAGGGGGEGERGAGPLSSWWSGDPEAKRRRRVAGYKAYAVEARVKATLRKGFRWIKDRCTGLVRRY